MAFRICKIFEVESGHMLSKNDDCCGFPHGHTRRIELIFESNSLDDYQMVCDYRAIKMLMKEYLDTFDHSMCVNTKDPNFEKLRSLYSERIIPFEDMDPTTEVIAKTIYEEACRRLAEYLGRKTKLYPMQDKIRVSRVRVWETSSSWAEYEE